MLNTLPGGGHTLAAFLYYLRMGIRMLAESTVRMAHADPGARTADTLRPPFPYARDVLERFLTTLDMNQPAYCNHYDADASAAVFMSARPFSGGTLVTVRGLKNVSRAQYEKFVSEADIPNLTGVMAIKLEAERILGVVIP
jgi:hypothetical protein